MAYSASPPARPPLTVFGFAATVLRHWKAVLGVPVLVAVLAAAVSYLLPTRYTATAEFHPEANAGATQLPSGLVGVAGQLGISLGSQGESAQFYANLLSTRRILDELLSVRFPNARGDSATLLAILHVKGDSASLRMENGAKTLRKRMAVSVDRPTSVVSVAFSMPTAVLAAAVANTAVDLLNRYNQETRQSQAKDQRIFVQGRVTDASHLLHAAEDSLREFHDANRQWQDSPRLQLEEARLQRGVSLRQQVLVSLVQELETAKIAEANDVPVITLVDPAITPSRKSWPRRVIIVLGSWLLCEIGVALVVVIREYRIYFVESDPEGVAALRAVWRRRSQPIRGNESGRGRESPL